MIGSLDGEVPEAAGRRARRRGSGLFAKYFPMVVPAQSPMESRRLDFLEVLRQLPAVTEVTHLDGVGREQLVVSRLAMERTGAGTDFSRDPLGELALKGNAGARAGLQHCFREADGGGHP